MKNVGMPPEIGHIWLFMLANSLCVTVLSLFLTRITESWQYTRRCSINEGVTAICFRVIRGSRRNLWNCEGLPRQVAHHSAQFRQHHRGSPVAGRPVFDSRRREFCIPYLIHTGFGAHLVCPAGTGGLLPGAKFVCNPSPTSVFMARAVLP